MKITELNREQVKAMALQGILNIKSLIHYDVCKQLNEGKSYFDISEEFGITERMVRYIEKCKCK